MKGTFRLLGLIFGGVAVVLLVIAGTFFGTTRHTLARYDRTSGTVVAVNTRGGAVTEPGAYEGQPVVEYVVAGRTYRWVDPVSSHPVSHDVGSTVTIAYDPDAPAKAKLPGPSSYLVSIITGGIGIVFLILAGVFLLVSLITGRLGSSASWAREATQGRFAFQTQASASPETYEAGVDSVTDSDQPGGYSTVRVSWTDSGGGSSTLELTGPEAAGLYPGDRVWVRTTGGTLGGPQLLHEKPLDETPPATHGGDEDGNGNNGGELPSVIKEL